MIDRFRYGVCYYPEHWPISMLPDDLARIKDCGFDFVRIGEGAWAYFEPVEGQYQFDLFDQVIAECQKLKLGVIFGTPTYCGPAWIAHKYPEVLRWNFDRTPMAHGSRRNYNYNSPAYQDLSDRITTELAEHYCNAKPIFAWQLDNEFNCHMDNSYAPSDTIAFRVWLENKYKTLDNLNESWGAKFWSQTYSAWNQIDLPHPTATCMNPSLIMDERRFISDSVCKFAKSQADILKRINPNWKITHNGLFKNIDGPKLVQELDYFCHDQYPQFFPDWTSYSAALIQTRSLSFPFGIMEQTSGPGGQMNYILETPRQNQMRLWTLHSIAHGAKLFSYFCWRTCPFGSEQHWHGLLDQDNRNNQRIHDAKRVGAELKSLPKEIFDAPVEKCLAVLRDFDNEINEQDINSYVKGAGGEAWRWQKAAQHAHIPVDHTWSTSDWNGYKVLAGLHVRIVDASLVKKFTQFVTNGGTLILGATAGTKDSNLHIRQQTAPGPFSPLAGVHVENWSTLPVGQIRIAKLSDHEQIEIVGYAESLKIKSANVLATWDTDDALLTNTPAITIKKTGKGQVIYVGGYLSDSGVSALLNWILRDLSIHPLLHVPQDVEMVIRLTDQYRYVWLLNHTGQTKIIQNLPRSTNLLTKLPINHGELELPAYDVAIIRLRRK